MPQQKGGYTDADLAPAKTGTMTAADVAGGADDALQFAQQSEPAAPSMLSAASDVLSGAVKGLGNTIVGLGEMVHHIPGVSDAIDRFYGVAGLSKAAFPLARQATEPANVGETVGKTAEQMGEFFLPTGLGGKLAKAAEIAKSAGLTMAQTGSPTGSAVAAGLTAVLPTGARKAADVAESSATKSMIRALGPAGGRGPTSAENLAAAEQIAPTLVKAGFSPLTQAGARTLAAKAIGKAGTEIQSALATFGSDPIDKATLLTKIAAKRQALKVPGASGVPFLPSGAAQTEDALWSTLADDVTRTEGNTQAIHDLKKAWNETVAKWGSDPAAGTQQAVYRAGGDLIRAQLANDSQKISEADRLFSFASKLSDIVNAPNVRRPGAGAATLLTPFARPAIGAAVLGTEGYREGGVTGAIAGAASGAALGQLIQSPGFRYLSAAMKQKLATALDAGDGAVIGRLIGSLTAQATGLARAHGDQ